MYEIDFLAVGKKAGDKCGDAIALRFVPPDRRNGRRSSSTRASKTTGRRW